MATDESIETVLGIVDGQLSRDEAVQLLKVRHATMAPGGDAI